MNISPSQLSSDSNAQRVKTYIRFALFHANSFEEIEPSFLGALWADIGLRYSVLKHSPEKRDQLVMEPGYVCFAALCSKRDETILNVDVPHRVQISFREAAPLVASYLEANGQEAARRLRRLNYLLSDIGNVIFVKRGLDATCGSLQPKLAAWIGGSVTTKHRLFHDKPERFEFQKGGVMASRVFAEPLVRPLSPLDVFMAIFTPESARDKDLEFIEEHLNCPPRDCVSLSTLRFVGVAFVKEFWNPNWPAFSGKDAATAALAQCAFVSELPSTASIRPDSVPQSSGLPPNVTSKSTELDPPVRRSLPFVDGCHLSPNVTI